MSDTTTSGQGNQRLGDEGRIPGNMARDLKRFVERVIPSIEPLVVKIPLLVSKGPDPGPAELPQAYLAPHLWFAYLYRHFPHEFKMRLCGSTDGTLVRFWQGVRADDPRRLGNPCDAL